MKKFSPLIKQFLEASFYSTFVLVKLEMNGEIFKASTLPYDITLVGDTYTTGLTLLNIDPPASSTSIDKETFRITFADPGFVFRGSAREAASGGTAWVRTGFFNTTGAPKSGSNNVVYQPNQPILSDVDMITIYRGLIDQASYRMSEDNGVVFELRCSSPMAALDAVNSMYTTRHSIFQRIPSGGYNDTCFDNVAIGGQAVELKWGREG